MESNPKTSKIYLYFGLTASFIAFIGFLFVIGIITNPLVLFLISLFIIVPLRKNNIFIQRFILLFSLVFIGWIISVVGYSLSPFVVSFLLAYMLEPFTNYLHSKNIPRWLTALLIVLLSCGIVTAIAIFVFPVLFSQLDNAIKQISSIVTSVSSYVESRKFYKLFESFGISSDAVKHIVQTELMPEIKTFISKILESLLSFLTSLSGVASQLINALLVPIFMFYFLNDFDKIKSLLKSLLERKNIKFLNDLRRINRIFRIYISWQITAAIIISTSCSILFSIFGIPYPIVLGIICGFLNPIPYLGSLSSMVICILTSALVNPDELLYLSLTSVSIILGLHFINAYLLEPNIAGKQVGLHPLILILSLFVFGTLFGFVGLMVAVPTTASLVMFFNDWRERTQIKSLENKLETTEESI